MTVKTFTNELLLVLLALNWLCLGRQHYFLNVRDLSGLRMRNLIHLIIIILNILRLSLKLLKWFHFIQKQRDVIGILRLYLSL